MFIVTGILLLLNVIDVVVHVVTDQVEPLRIAGNIIVIVSALGVLLIPRVRRAWVAIAAGLWSLVLNLIHLSQSGIGTAGIVFIAGTTVLCLVLGVQLARRLKPLI